jgi:hypothetical protein
MTRIAPILATAAAATALISFPTATTTAANYCAERTDMIKSLAEQFKENPAAVGIINPSAVIEVFVSEDGSWTILATGTDGKSCVLSAGIGWETNVLAIGEGA